jgi:hypothetical protein
MSAAWKHFAHGADGGVGPTKIAFGLSAQMGLACHGRLCGSSRWCASKDKRRRQYTMERSHAV